MTIRAFGRFIFVLLASVFVFGAAPAGAACVGENCVSDTTKSEAVGKPVSLKSFAKKRVRVAGKATHRRHAHRIASKRKAAPAEPKEASVERKAMPAEVAEARAELITGETKATLLKLAAEKLAAVKASSTPAVAAAPAPEAAIQVVSADELNDIDRAAADSKPPSFPVLSASIANSRAEMQDDQSSAWAQTSTIGRAFIFVGLMLTLASAARMFMA